MASSLKGQKDKPHTGAPRLVPRPTAASAARAARIATNRNLLVSNNSKQSITRTSTSPSKPAVSHSPVNRSPPQTAHKLQDLQKDQLEDATLESQNNDHIVVCFKQDTVSSCVSNASLKVVDSCSTEKSSKILQHIAEDAAAAAAATKEKNEETFEISRETDDDSLSQSTRKSRVSLNAESSLKTESASPNNSRPVTPVTPTVKSRSQTPKRASRPQTPQSPRIASRPVTPCHPNQRLGSSSSRPVTPQQRTSATPPGKLAKHLEPRHYFQDLKPDIRKLALPSRPRNPGSTVDQAPTNAKVDESDVKAVFAAKQKQFREMKKDLDLKQQTMLEFYEGLKSLQQQVADEGSPEAQQLQEMVVFNVADWTAEEVSELCRDAAAAYCIDGAAEFITTITTFDDTSLTNLDQQVLEVPTRFAELCLKAFTARQEVIDWVKDMVQNSNAEVGSGEAVNRIAVYNTQGLEFCESLRELKHFSDVAVESMAKLSRRAVQERRALIAAGEKLVHEVARLGEEVKQLRENCFQQRAEMPGDIESIRFELEEERAAKTQTKEKLASTESQLRQARQRITKMDRQLREAEASISSLTGTVKSLEDQSRQKEVQLEAKARKLRESLKTGEMTNNQIVQQRNSLQLEVQELKDQIANMDKEHKMVVQELNTTIKELSLSLEEQRGVIQTERDMKAATEEVLGNTQLLVQELQNKIHHYEVTKPNPDLPSEKEMTIWSELQAVKETLRATEEEVAACKREKIRFLETLTKIGDTDNNKVGMQQKLAAELVTKEEIIGKMQYQLREYTKNLKLNEQKVAQYEQFTRDLIAHQKAIEANQNVQSDYPDFQQEIMKLRMELLNAVHRSEDLAEQLAIKEQQIEQQDKTSRAQARVIKVREELINLLKSKETEQSRELSCLQQDLEQRMKIVDEVNHQIAAKADEIQELFATLESKQQQIHRLEKIVLALEEQQRRAQAQRTRHEEKIAALEHELAGPRRERKYLFF